MDNPGENCAGCRTNGIDDDGNGYVDDCHGWDFVNDDNDPTDDNGHGTHVAGTIGAVGNNGIGVAGVNWNVTIMPLKFLDSIGSGSTADAVSAILYARAKGVAVMNNSWGGGDFSQALEDAIERRRREGDALRRGRRQRLHEHRRRAVLAVELRHAEHHLGRRHDQFDRKGLVLELRRAHGRPLRARARNVYSTWKGSTYRFADGTSMAAPHVSGAAALVKAAFPNASGVGLKALLLRTVDPIAALSGASRTAADD